MNADRRTFLQSSIVAATALLSSKHPFTMAAPESNDTKKDARLFILATNWGFPGTLEEFCTKIQKDGYDGMEIWWPSEKKGQDELFAALKKYDLRAGFLCAGQQKNFNEHLSAFTQMVDAAANNSVQKPLYINCHSGRDYFSVEQSQQFFDHTLALAKKTGILICHETHRSRILFAAPVARHHMERNPDLKITFDVSHWCNVSESLLQDQEDTLALAIERTGHIHARIGHPEGPQVNDPRAPEWADAMKAHLEWWDKIVARRVGNGEQVTILTEFGPVDYMPALPYSRQPVADQWAINVYMMHFLRDRYSKIFQ